ncbi:hypothetical protein EIN_093690 [Entamoeba invadens IP1]|uniref:Leucine rich repeat containing protein BspA family protein n=1 Tax=Entamoeba invadens IP1 TaxID=370355 RepID=A0A0A1TZZ6_ENTIV|nr:hypothetical protein EIN_093690 [Entamoeba invadens IP1]ELP87212.1 hypothetical protein EIN_093690 [Entamoeba invadens IP1]|eukprot:XP_004253983.1 hypothetical protein EIN_093690 [Entamoeba invadens IP1]
MSTLSGFHLMIVSKYFSTFRDFLNVEIVCKKFRGNTEKFHFNPIPLTLESIDEFPNLETLVLYSENDPIFTKRRIFKTILSSKTSYGNYLNYKEFGVQCNKVELDKIQITQFDQIDSEKVTHLACECYSRSSTLKHVILPPKLEEVGYGCFKGCKCLETIQFPTTVLSIGCVCFDYCGMLSSVTLPLLIKEIKEWTFNHCFSLKKINIPQSVTSIKYGAFSDCTSLSFLTIHNKIKEFGLECFKNCFSMKEIKIKNSNYCVQCGLRLVYNSSNKLVSFQLPHKNVFVNDFPFILLKDCSTKYTIPFGIKSIRKYCFYKTPLEKVKFTTTLKKICQSSFEKCNNLFSVDLPTSIIRLEKNSFDSSCSLRTINIPQTLKNIEPRTFNSCSNLIDVQLYHSTNYEKYVPYKYPPISIPESTVFKK